MMLDYFAYFFRTGYCGNIKTRRQRENVLPIPSEFAGAERGRADN